MVLTLSGPQLIFLTGFLPQVLCFIIFNLFMHDVEKWPTVLLKFCIVHTARFLMYVWPFFNIHERVKVFDLLLIANIAYCSNLESFFRNY